MSSRSIFDFTDDSYSPANLIKSWSSPTYVAHEPTSFNPAAITLPVIPSPVPSHFGARPALPVELSRAAVHSPGLRTLASSRPQEGGLPGQEGADGCGRFVIVCVLSVICLFVFLNN
jgi:hypothetical protein